MAGRGKAAYGCAQASGEGGSLVQAAGADAARGPSPAAALDLLRSDLLSSLAAIRRRYSAYLASEICLDISEHDDMFVAGKLDHYLSVGRSAIDMLARAMVLAQKERFAAVLDLPCGGGRVTRHLKAFLPEARLFVGDLNKAKEAFVIEKFGAVSINPRADFSEPSREKFDLIFVGSLVTHLGLGQYTRAVRWFIEALAPNGLLVLTTHGRRTFHLFRATFHSPEWQAGLRSYQETGFGYQPYEPGMPMDGPSSYGTSLSLPSWVARLVESEPGARLLSIAEGAWANNQDIVILQKKPIAAG
jgi:SAM-dependent methyltransferase